MPPLLPPLGTGWGTQEKGVTFREGGAVCLQLRGLGQRPAAGAPPPL